MLGDCPHVKEHWQSLMKPIHWSRLKTSNKKQWLKWNLNEDIGKTFSDEEDENLGFGIATLYKAKADLNLLKTSYKKGRGSYQSKWFCYDTSEVRLDMDGSYKNGVGKCNDIIHDSNANWLMGFNSNIGNSSHHKAAIP
ncbi:uncharacterized protein LOC129299243 [Prosopis cineraria]|uniref:uncharacterized protein LOC129299243 n=1 Tax=Prosopis cineraria TaxID=364024 RepID=UPI00240F342F|nr:uncharacterized protein LOC129299243 [Prosopis cineraria]